MLNFSPYASIPINRFYVLNEKRASSRGPLALKWSYVLLLQVFKILYQIAEKKKSYTAKYMHQILDLALPAFDELFEDVDMSGLIESNGILYFWNDQNLKSRDLEIKIREDLGVKQQLVTPKEKYMI